MGYRVNELIRSIENKVIIQTAQTGMFENSKAAQTLKALREFRQEMSADKANQQQIIKFYAAPLNGPQPNGNEGYDGFDGADNGI